MVTNDSRKGGVRGVVVGIFASVFVTAITYFVNPFGSEEIRQKITGLIVAEMQMFSVIGFVLFVISLVKGWERLRKKEISDYVSTFIIATTGSFTALHLIFTYIISENQDKLSTFLQMPKT